MARPLSFKQCHGSHCTYLNSNINLVKLTQSKFYPIISTNIWIRRTNQPSGPVVIVVHRWRCVVLLTPPTIGIRNQY